MSDLRTDPEALRQSMVEFRTQWDRAEHERETMIERRRELVDQARALTPPMTQTAIAELLGVSQVIVNRICKR